METTFPQTPLSRNRSYTLLWTSRTLSELGFHTTLIALPLLALAVTGSPAVAGLLQSINAVAQLVTGLPAGALVDRWPRKAIMLVCEAARAVVLTTLVVALVTDTVTVWHLFVVTAVVGACAAVFDPAEEATLPAIVPAAQLPTAIALNTARSHVGQLSGTSLGGILFGVRKVFPFLLDALTHLVAFLLLLFVRVPPRDPAPRPKGGLLAEVREGVAWVLRQRFIRTISLYVIGLNFLFQVLYITAIVSLGLVGTSSTQIGFMAAMFGAGGLLGAMCAPWLYRKLNHTVAIAGVFWALAALTPFMAFQDNGYLMGGLLAGMAFLAPTANTIVGTYQLLLTPDEFRGRMSSVMNLCGGLSVAGGAGLAGLLLEWVPSAWVFTGCAVALAALAIAVTSSGILRRLPGAGSTGEAEGQRKVPS
ncbi:MFS transporter [Actinoalloteichus sp. AHMU CJ021]|uniref:MFS transporter n=1 Tax=Actinoalloteichus sp. AHMU CJ021 TaxID=2072503 RepID=UPI000CA05DDF|nr:MFS transporter [Actinoalloteichus sp. AHMU CJ021]